MDHFSWGQWHLRCHHPGLDQSHTRLTAHGASGVLMYSKNCRSTSVNEARQLIFTVGLRPLEFIPTTQHALLQHTKRTLPITAFWIIVFVQSIQHSKPKRMGLGMEWKNKGVGTIVDQSARCQQSMLSVAPLWPLGCLQGKLQVSSSWTSLWPIVQVQRRLHKQCWWLRFRTYDCIRNVDGHFGHHTAFFNKRLVTSSRTLKMNSQGMQT